MADEKHVVKIEITSSGTETVIGMFKSLKSTVTGIRSAIGKAFSLLGTFGFIINGVSALVETFQKLKSWIDEARNSARRLAEEIVNANYEGKVSAAAIAYKKLNEELAKALQLEQDRNKVLDAREQRGRAIEDARLELQKQQELAQLDVTSEDYQARKNDIERRYQSEASRLANDRAQADTAKSYDRLRKEADAEESAAAAKQKRFDAVYETESSLSVRASRLWQQARRGDEVAQEQLKIVEPQLDKLRDTLVKLLGEIEAHTSRAKALRRESGEIAYGDGAARLRNDATQLRLQTEAENERRLRDKKVEDEANAARLKQEEETQRQAAREAEREVRDQQHAADSRVNQLEDFASSVARQGEGGNRLTALGLGDGGGGNHREIGTIISQLQKLIDATRQNRPKDIDTTALFNY